MFHQVLYICIGNSTFESNTVTGSDGAGGAVYGSLSHIAVDNSIFSYNNNYYCKGERCSILPFFMRP